jgi:hypothetical protein
LRPAQTDFYLRTGLKRALLATGHIIVIRPEPDGHAVVAIVASGTEIILPEMPHTVGEQVLKLYLGNILQKILLEERFAVLEVPALKGFGIDKMSQHI